MDLISLIVVIVLFACICWGLAWVVRTFGMPQPVLWIIGALLIIILLMFLLKATGVYSLDLHTPVIR